MGEKKIEKKIRKELPKFFVDRCLDQGQPHNDRSASIKRQMKNKETLVQKSDTKYYRSRY